MALDDMDSPKEREEGNGQNEVNRVYDGLSSAGGERKPLERTSIEMRNQHAEDILGKVVTTIEI